MSSSLDTIALVGAGLLVLSFLTRKRNTSPLPAGPKGFPLIGNLLDVPTDKAWLTYADMRKKWGDLFSLSVFGTTIVVVNSYEITKKLLVDRGAIYSDRPYLPMAMDVMEMKDSTGAVSYTRRLKSMRKLYHSGLGTNDTLKPLLPHLVEEAQRFIRSISKDPKDLHDSVFKLAGTVILRVAYGYRVTEEDPYRKNALIAMDNLNKATNPTKFPVNLIPAMMYIPEWAPGGGFKKIGREWAKDYWAMVDLPFNWVKEQLALGIENVSFTSSWLKKELPPLEEEDLKFLSSALFGAGSETTAITIQVFFLMMCINPDIQRRLQAEVDTVCGRGRLPSFSDRENMPYLNAVIKEVLRYHVSVPLALPHCTSQDDIFEGKLLPKGAMIFPNIWWMTHDPARYPEPLKFDPARFLGPSPQTDPSEFVFGFGRRICVGRLLAEQTLFITLAMTASVFDITPVAGQIPEYRPKDGFISGIEPFECAITRRADAGKLDRELESL